MVKKILLVMCMFALSGCATSKLLYPSDLIADFDKQKISMDELQTITNDARNTYLIIDLRPSFYLPGTNKESKSFLESKLEYSVSVDALILRGPRGEKDGIRRKCDKDNTSTYEQTRCYTNNLAVRQLTGILSANTRVDYVFLYGQPSVETRSVLIQSLLKENHILNKIRIVE